MIPIQLQLTNFLSYRQTAAVDFNGLHLACIAGLNGAGKSSILDGITWALFGKSRARSDDDIVNRLAARDGETAEVRLDFELETVVYRIIRRKKVQRAMVVELQVAVDYEAEEWKSLTKARRRETDEAIELLLGMNFDTFSNASFLLQGQADEFTTKTPGQRKEVLADLLQVNVWNQYRQTVSEKRKEAEVQINVLDGQIGEIEIELAAEPARMDAFKTSKAEHDLVLQQKNAREAFLVQARQTDSLIQQQRQTVDQAASLLTRESQRLINLKTRHQKLEAERTEHQALLDVADEIAAQYAAWQAADAAVAAHQTQANEHNRLEREMRPHQLTIAQEESRLKQRQQSLTAQAQRVSAMQDERLTVSKKMDTIERELAILTEQLAALAAEEAHYQEQHTQLQRLDADQRVRLQEKEQLQRTAKQIDQLRRDLHSAQQNQAAAQNAVMQMQRDLNLLEQQQKEAIELQSDLNVLDNEQPFLKEQMDKFKARITQLEDTTSGVCPLCGQALTDDHRITVIAEVQTEGKAMADRYRANRKRRPELEHRLKGLETQLARRERLQGDIQTQQQRQTSATTRATDLQQQIDRWETGERVRLATLQQEIEVAEVALVQARETAATLRQTISGKEALEKDRHTAAQTKANCQARLDEIDRLATQWETEGSPELTLVTDTLASGNWMPAAQAAFAELTVALTAVGYDETAHQQAIASRANVEDAPRRHQAWEKAVSAAAMIDSNLQTLKQEIEEQTELVAEQERQHMAVKEVLEQLTVTADFDLQALEREVHQLREAEVEALRRVTRAEQLLLALDDQRERRAQLREERAAFTLRVQRLKMIEKACGRDGVQGLLIEHALPEIEEAANLLLDRLTDGQMRVEFTTQKELKSKRDTLAETLEIRIADTAGVRPYENYSGGEQFRVNFAIRIALSQILAKRAGARLQTLVIDEGFGSQDPLGRQRLIEAINAIKDDFQRILVITHIAELRDAFPNRIEVTKNPTGSTIEVV